MGLSDYIDAVRTTPMLAVSHNGSWLANPISCTFDRSFDQDIASAAISFATPVTVVPDDKHEIKIYLGYNGNYACVLTGYADDYDSVMFPFTYEIKVRDVLKRADYVWLDDITPAVYADTQAETAVSDLLSKAGLSVTAGTSSFTIGDVNPAKFQLTSILEAVKKIGELIGWHLWAGQDGTVYFQYQKPRPNESSSPTWTYTYGVNVLKRSYTKTDKSLRNRIVVEGWWNPDNDAPIRSVKRADSAYTNKDRTAILSSDLIDLQSMADTIAGWMLHDLNSLVYIYEMEVPGNPLINVGDTIRIIDSQLSLDKKFFVFSISGRIDGSSGEFTYRVTAIRWDTSDDGNYEPPAPPGPPINPPEPGPYPPAPVSIGEIYDISDGVEQEMYADTTTKLLYFPPARTFQIDSVSAYCENNLAKLNVYANGYRTCPYLTVYRDADGKWTVERYDGSTGDLISTWTDAIASDNLISHVLEGGDLVIVNNGLLFSTEVVTGAETIMGFGYSLGNHLYGAQGLYY